MTSAHGEPVLAREQGLARQLGAGQQLMIAIGGAIGTGLFLGTTLAVGVAGPSVVISYLLCAAIALLLGRALTDLAVAHPTAGSFGLYAELYLSPLAGYAVRITYWLASVTAVGSQLVAVSIYMQFWFPGVPGAAWVLAFSLALVYVNSRVVGQFGTVEYWLSMIKVVAVALFAVVAAALLCGLTRQPSPGLSNYLARGGLFPFGAAGVWAGACFATFSFIGVELAAVTAGEARDPAKTIPAAFRRLVGLLSAIYVVTTALLFGVLPWTQIGTSESPFVTVLVRIGIPLAASLMNVVVVTAALSSANAYLYATARTTFSLARGGFVPAALGELSPRGIPMNALFASSAGMAAAVLARALWPDAAYVLFVGAALFGGVFVWLVIFLTHVVSLNGSRRRTDVRRKAGSMAGALLMAGILVSTWWVPGLRITLEFGVPWLVVVAVAYAVAVKSRPSTVRGAPRA